MDRLLLGRHRVGDALRLTSRHFAPRPSAATRARIEYYDQAPFKFNGKIGQARVDYIK